MVDYLVPIHRHVTDNLLAALADTPVVLLSGARQTGKSTLVQSADLKDRQYLTFDDAGVLAAARNDPNGFIAGLAGKTTLDEIQHVPELFQSIKLAVDREREPGRFLLTGSANVLALPKLSESLAGRMEVLTLWPFSQGEIRGARETFIDNCFSNKFVFPGAKAKIQRKRSEIIEVMLAGGYPPALARKSRARRGAWFTSYATTILQRDVRDLSNIEDLSAVPRLLAVVASRAGGLLNYADLSRTLGLPQTTLKRYFALLEMTFLVQLLRPWSARLGQRSILTPKVYLNDTGMLAHFLGLTTARLEADQSLTGALAENFVMMELLKQSTWSETKRSLFFWRTAAGREVDFVLEDSAGRIVGIEVKAGATLHRSDLAGLQAMAEQTGKKWVRGIVLYTGTDVIPFAANLHGVPLETLWSLAEF
jgi:predicted AAA+ superfamily ATPase